MKFADEALKTVDKSKRDGWYVYFFINFEKNSIYENQV